jgi:predicted RNase H-like HicB family nuclease
MTEGRKLHVNVNEEDGAFWATVDEFPGVFAAGDDLAELRTSLEEGIALVLAEPSGDAPAIRLSPLTLARAEPTLAFA